MAKGEGTDRLSALPAELRNMIYKLVYAQSEPYRVIVKMWPSEYKDVRPTVSFM